VKARVVRAQVANDSKGSDNGESVTKVRASRIARKGRAVTKVRAIFVVIAKIAIAVTVAIVGRVSRERKGCKEGNSRESNSSKNKSRENNSRESNKIVDSKSSNSSKSDSRVVREIVGRERDIVVGRIAREI
jgi:hypothetical protein